MPKAPKTKEKTSISLSIGLLRAIKKKAKGNGIKLSQQIERDLLPIYHSNKAYLEHELKIAVDHLRVIKFRIDKYHSQKKIKKLMK